MPVLESEALVLLRHPLTESSWIVSFFTREEGMIRGVAKGARRTKSPFRGTLEPMNRVRVTLSWREGRDLAAVSGVDLLNGAMELFGGWETARVLMAVAETLERGLPPHHAEEETYRLVLAARDALREGAGALLTWRYFQVWFLKLHGVFPGRTTCGRCGGVFKEASFRLAESEWICRRCRRGVEDAGMAMTPEALTLLGGIFSKSLGQMAAKPPAGEEALGPLGRLCDALLTDYLGRPLASSPG